MRRSAYAASGKRKCSPTRGARPSGMNAWA
ncbi:Uncharacterised protein [Bordetella pertussis]|nr:Uncharacterised protein [Bordetella pertussis]